MNESAYSRRETSERGPRRVKIRRLPFTAVLRVAIALGVPWVLLFSCVATGLVVIAVRAARELLDGFSSRTITGPLNFNITINPIEMLGMQDLAAQIQRADDGMFFASIFVFIILVLVAAFALTMAGFFGSVLSDLFIRATGGITVDVEDA